MTAAPSTEAATPRLIHQLGELPKRPRRPNRFVPPMMIYATNRCLKNGAGKPNPAPQPQNTRNLKRVRIAARNRQPNPRRNPRARSAALSHRKIALIAPKVANVVKKIAARTRARAVGLARTVATGRVGEIAVIAGEIISNTIGRPIIIIAAEMIAVTVGIGIAEATVLMNAMTGTNAMTAVMRIFHHNSRAAPCPPPAP